MIQTIFGWPTLNDLTFILIGLLGMLAHYLKRYNAGEINDTLMEYFIRNNWAATLTAVIAYLMSMLATLATMPKEVSFYALIYMAFTAGYTSDSAFNRVKEDRNKIQGILDDQRTREKNREDIEFLATLNREDFKDFAPNFAPPIHGAELHDD